MDDSVRISPRASLGLDIVIERGSTIRDGVRIGGRAYIGERVILGERTRDYFADPRGYLPLPLRIGDDAVIRSGAIIYSGSIIGDHFEMGSYAQVREHSYIGKNVSLGTMCDIQGFVLIGDNVRCHSEVHIAQRTTIMGDVLLFPRSMTLNTLHPTCTECLMGPVIEKYVIVGAGAIIFPLVRIGEGALVGAGAVVTRDVPAGKVVAGIPARVVGDASDIECRYEPLLARQPGFHPYPWRGRFRIEDKLQGARRGKEEH